MWLLVGLHAEASPFVGPVTVAAGRRPALAPPEWVRLERAFLVAYRGGKLACSAMPATPGYRGRPAAGRPASRR
jgi:hypothetical protein